MAEQIHKRKSKVGRVVSNKMNKTVSVAVERLVLHPVFKKYHKRLNRFMAHDEKQQCQVGDLVEIIETKPLSKNKRWAVRSVIKKGELEGEENKVAGTKS